ncbi:MAG: mannose-1-phosphate guanylyltransferase/mannose-6-phosphate isomerase [Hyphomonadaceae bacterium]|nr:mannose-1-phosphate guanylyltransferase/mannose-6-phosphate isomerase [Hyphomonadaceae bacterium]MBC6412803.1 mannose-1-phosphate guanylyltransferase/mannose-6-phosphate isomerase [Hyphomonadaceae bacterium]
MTETRIIPVIMCGGTGSRLWPLSRRTRPKQLLPLVTEKTMLQETVARFDPPVFTAPVLVCNAFHVEATQAQMAATGRDIGAIIVEPAGRDTAACAVVAARYAMAADGDAPVLLVPADHHVKKPQALCDAIRTALPAAKNGRIVTFGITPDHPQTGYAYIEQGALIFEGVYAVNSFREKPDRETAKACMERGSFFWNTGLFLFSPQAFLNEIERFVPEIGTAASQAFEKANRTDSVFNLDADIFATCPAESIDHAVMEHTDKAAIVPVHTDWTDVGSWKSLRDTIASGPESNAVKGPVHVQDSRDCLVQSDSHHVTVLGLDNVGVIVNEGEVLVLNLDKAQDIKQVVTRLGETDQKQRPRT